MLFQLPKPMMNPRIFRVLATICLFLIACATVAQTTTTVQTTVGNGDDRLLPVQKDMGLTFDLTGLVNSVALSSPTDPNGNNALLFRYYTQDNRAFRLGFGVTTVSHRSNQVDSVGQARVDYDSTYSRTDFYIAPGFERHLVGSRRLDPYLGGNVVLGVTGKPTTAINIETSDTIGVSTVKTDIDQSGGTVFGLNVIGGFNYFFSKRLAVGAEYSFGFATRSAGGDFSAVTVDTPVSGGQSVTRVTGSDLTRNTGLAMASTAGITLSWFFARNPKE